MQFRFLLIIIVFAGILFQGCFVQCITGGNLHVKKKYVSNFCGLVNGVYIEEIKVDSLHHEIPVKYSRLRTANLYREGATPDKDPKRLYFIRDCKAYYTWKNGKITDTVKGALDFKLNNWYLFSSTDSNTSIFMFIDGEGRKTFKEVSEKSRLVNF